MLRFIFFAFHLNLLFSGTAFAVTTTATVSYCIHDIDAISVSGGSSGSPAPFMFTTATPGSQPASMTDSSTSLSITTNCCTSRTLSCQLSPAMPEYATMLVNVAAGSSGGTSAGDVNVTDGQVYSLVTGLKQACASNMTITYTCSVTVEAEPQASTASTLTYTLQ